MAGKCIRHRVAFEARALMEELPLGQAGLMKHEFIELGPLTPLHQLLTDGGARNEIMTIGDL